MGLLKFTLYSLLTPSSWLDDGRRGGRRQFWWLIAASKASSGFRRHENVSYSRRLVGNIFFFYCFCTISIILITIQFIFSSVFGMLFICLGLLTLYKSTNLMSVLNLLFVPSGCPECSLSLCPNLLGTQYFSNHQVSLFFFPWVIHSKFTPLSELEPIFAVISSIFEELSLFHPLQFVVSYGLHKKRRCEEGKKEK